MYDNRLAISISRLKAFKNSDAQKYSYLLKINFTLPEFGVKDNFCIVNPQFIFLKECDSQNVMWREL